MPFGNHSHRMLELDIIEFDSDFLKFRIEFVVMIG